ncbi:Molybdopterin synthase catalytic subunit [Thalassocella blandensis]|nr:Molybdopterin synthase catalytic subunit [Thalassocella blandensis]
MISVQTEDFQLEREYQRLIARDGAGAVVTFIGRVRDFASGDKTFLLQHYPGMTEKVLERIEQEAKARWSIIASTIIHRVGSLNIHDQIVFVGVSSKHRRDAFAACEYMIDILKTQAPFWKKEGQHWVEAKDSDQAAADAWLNADSWQALEKD